MILGVVETFKKRRRERQKLSRKENINSEGGIKEGDTILVVEKRWSFFKSRSSIDSNRTSSIYSRSIFQWKSLYEGLNGLLNNQLEDLAKEQEQAIENKRLNKKEETWEELYKKL